MAEAEWEWVAPTLSEPRVALSAKKLRNFRRRHRRELRAAGTAQAAAAAL